MQISIIAIGRLRHGPELELFNAYQTRFNRMARALGFASLNIVELECKKGGGKPAEAALIAKAIPKTAYVTALDERGEMQSSSQFANTLARHRDQGAGHMVFIIGGADGIDPTLLDKTQAQLSFGPMVWPHLVARVMVCEQIYRAASILAGTPYHRA